MLKFRSEAVLLSGTTELNSPLNNGESNLSLLSQDLKQFTSSNKSSSEENLVLC
jgi:hypothetical protein